MHRPASSVLVVGAGVVGLACALRLQQCGFDVVVVDPDRSLQAASWGNAGHVATEQVEPLASPANLRSALSRFTWFGGPLAIRDPVRIAPWLWSYLRASTPARFAAGRGALAALLANALPAWQDLVQQLGDRSLLRADGHWLCWESEATAEQGVRRWKSTDIGTARLDARVAPVLDALAEQVGVTLHGGVRFSGTGQIADPVRLARAMTERLLANGGERVFQRVLGLQASTGLVSASLDDGRIVKADQLLVSAGVRSRALLASLGIDAPLVAERGYHLQWRDHDWPAEFPPVVFEDRSIIVTRFEHGLRVAGFVEYADVESPPNPRLWDRLRRHVDDLGLPVRGEPTCWFGARPTLPDYLPAIGRCRQLPQVLYAFGHQHLGTTLAAVTGEAIADLASGRTGSLNLAPYDLARFH